MNLFNILFQASAPVAVGSYGGIGILFFVPIIVLILVLVIVFRNKKNESMESLSQTNQVLTSDSISPNERLNKIVNVNLIGGIIGLFIASPVNALNKIISRENANGWKVVQIIPSDSGNIFLTILRFLLLIITFFLYTTTNGYYIILEKKSY